MLQHLMISVAAGQEKPLLSLSIEESAPQGVSGLADP